jgi:hypothetical protein
MDGAALTLDLEPCSSESVSAQGRRMLGSGME